MGARPITAVIAAAALTLSACGGGKQVDTAKYTCADFKKSLATKGDDTAGNYVNQLRKQAKLGQDEKTERREVTLGVYLACRGKPGSTRPAKTAIATAKSVKGGKFKLPKAPAAKKKRSGQ
jgi:hypothetical protein